MVGTGGREHQPRWLACGQVARLWIGGDAMKDSFGTFNVPKESFMASTPRLLALFVTGYLPFT
jgi:hypothetical protein